MEPKYPDPGMVGSIEPPLSGASWAAPWWANTRSNGSTWASPGSGRRPVPRQGPPERATHDGRDRSRVRVLSTRTSTVERRVIPNARISPARAPRRRAASRRSSRCRSRPRASTTPRSWNSVESWPRRTRTSTSRSGAAEAPPRATSRRWRVPAPSASRYSSTRRPPDGSASSPGCASATAPRCCDRSERSREPNCRVPSTAKTGH